MIETRQVRDVRAQKLGENQDASLATLGEQASTQEDAIIELAELADEESATIDDLIDAVMELASIEGGGE